MSTFKVLQEKNHFHIFFFFISLLYKFFTILYTRPVHGSVQFGSVWTTKTNRTEWLKFLKIQTELNSGSNRTGLVKFSFLALKQGNLITWIPKIHNAKHENYTIDFLHGRIFCIRWSLIAPFQFSIYNNKQKPNLRKSQHNFIWFLSNMNIINIKINPPMKF